MKILLIIFKNKKKQLYVKVVLVNFTDYFFFLFTLNKEKCHKGHSLGDFRFSNAYCDCPDKIDCQIFDT